jgi:perosamine synthetase
MTLMEIEKVIFKVANLLPCFPKPRYNIFCGTNHYEEWLHALVDFLNNSPVDDLDLIQAYEEAFADAVSVRYAFSFGAGRMGFFAILEALGIGCGHEVVLPAFTCVVVPNAIIYRGARPIYADIEAKTFNVDLNVLEKSITSRTKALYAQHTFGIPCDLDGIKQLASKYNLPVIEDCGHALGSIYKGNKVGSLADVGYFTTDHSKIINTHLGGMVVTNNDDIAKRLREIQDETLFLSRKDNRRLLRTFLLEYLNLSPMAYWLGKPIHVLLNKLKINFYFSDELITERPQAYPYPSRLSSPQARIGISQLSYLEDNLTHRRRIASWLEKKIGWYGFDESEVNAYAWLRYSFLVKDRDAFERRLRKHFDLGIWFTSVVSGRNCEFEKVGYLPSSCPVGEFVSRKIVNFPTHSRISPVIIQRVVEKNHSWLLDQVFYP